MTGEEAIEQEPCECAIIREDVEECKELMTDINGDTVYAVRMSDIRQLPSVNLREPKTGYWISHHHGCEYECSECHDKQKAKSKYCPNCGCRMVEPQESEG